MDDDVFSALADPTRRSLLDQLFSKSGQSLAELCKDASITRFGIMKHLRILEEAGLVTSRKSGREKLHYLNPVPIRLIHDRWVSKFTVPLVATMAHLKTILETPMKNNGSMQVYEVFIQTTPEKLWSALTEAAFTQNYFFGTMVKSTWKAGDPIVYTYPDGRTAVDGVVIESAPPRRLVHTWVIRWDEKASHETSKVTWTIEPRGSTCKLTVTHELENAPLTGRIVGSDGWTFILSSLKTLLETGKSMLETKE